MGSNSTTSKPLALVKLQEFLSANPGVEFINIQLSDYFGIVRGLCIPVSRALLLAEKNGSLEFGSPVASRMLPDDSPIWEIITPGTDLFWPDWESLVVCGYAPHRAVVPSFLEENSRGLEMCPRASLRNVQQRAAASHGIDFLIGFEIEFYLAESASATRPIDSLSTAYTASAMRQPGFAVVEDAVRALEKVGIRVWSFHSEGSTGFYEIALLPLPPLQAVDALVAAQETIRSTAVQRGLHATMHPKPFEGYGNCGTHAHVSLNPVAGSHKSSIDQEVADSFLQGMLDSLPALCALTMPNLDSITRLARPDGTIPWITWGDTLRTATIRRVKHAHWEFRPIDAMGNMYLALTAILGVGLAAVARRDKLQMKPRTEESSSLKLSDELRESLGITQKIPNGLAEACEALKRDENVKRALGDAISERYLRIKQREIEHFQGMVKQDRIHVFMRQF